MNQRHKKNSKRSNKNKPKGTPANRSSAPAKTEPPKLVQDAHGHQIEVQRTELRSHSGPLPAAWTLQEYEDIVPGSAKEIIGAFVDQTKHRRRLESNGQYAAIALLLGGLLLAAWCAYLGLAWPAGVVGVAALGTGGVAWVTGGRRDEPPQH